MTIKIEYQNTLIEFEHITINTKDIPKEDYKFFKSKYPWLFQVENKKKK